MKLSDRPTGNSKRKFKPIEFLRHYFPRGSFFGNVAAICIVGAAQGGTSPQYWVAAKSVRQVPTISAFATVQSSGLIRIVTTQSGVVAGLSIRPGQVVAAGQTIARLRGPQIATASIQASANHQTALAVERAADESLTAEKQKLRQHLSTQQLVAQARSALVAAKAQVLITQANANLLQEAITLKSPSAGIVQDLNVANGDIVTKGQVLATIQPNTGSWLKAVFYGDAVPADAKGVFTTGNDAAKIKVSLRGAFGVAQSDGGMPVALTALQSLIPGTFGRVTLDLPAQTVTIIPSDALILDKGKWWVVRHDASGDRPVQVIPGSTKGYNTIIKSGLRPGDAVVVVNAYLLYNRGIAARYQPPN